MGERDRGTVQGAEAVHLEECVASIVVVFMEAYLGRALSFFRTSLQLRWYGGSFRLFSC